MVAHDLSDAALGGGLGKRGRHLIDAHGRALLLRGVNVGGASKLPSAPQDMPTTYADPEHVTFVDRPFPLNEAPMHCARLQQWGLTLVRLLVTWEALSHAGPCPEYPIDADYVMYLRRLMDVFAAHGIKVLVNAHQDVWSRLCGGSGAPGWTFRAAGMDLAGLVPTGAALVPESGTPPMPSVPPHGKPEPTGPFNWPSGYQKMAPSTMVTLFWAGRVFAPRLCLLRDTSGRARTHDDAVNIQDFLQDAYLAAYAQLAAALAPCEAVVGFEVMNEPHRGYINLYSFHRWCYETDLHIGHFPSALQGMALGEGYAQDIPFYVKSWPVPSRRSHYAHVKPTRSAWAPRAGAAFLSTRATDGCVWREHGVWTWDEQKKKPVVLQADYFHVDPRPGQRRRRIEWYRDFYEPFVQRFAERVAAAKRGALLLVEPIPNEFMPRWPADVRSDASAPPAPLSFTAPTTLSTPRPTSFVYAPHFYDLNVLFFKAYNGLSVNVQGLARGMFILCALYFGAHGVMRNYRHQISNLVRKGYQALGDVPVVVGEVGIPYDVNDSLRRTPGDYSVQRILLYALVSALEESLVSFTLWNYNPSNSTARGDVWNMEDFSIINLEAHASDLHNRLRDEPLYAGGRAMDAILRPYACKVAGVPLSTHWDADAHTFTFVWATASDSCTSATTEVFMPDYVYRGYEPEIRVSDGAARFVRAEQTLYVEHADMAPGAVHKLTVCVPQLAKRHRVPLVLCLAPLAVLVAWLLYR